MKVISAEYCNTGGNCYCMFAHVQGCEELGEDGKDFWLIGSVDCYDVPLLGFYRSERGADEAFGEGDADYIGECNTDTAPWTIELWKEMFQYCLEHDYGYNHRAVAEIDYQYLKDNFKEWF